MDSVETECTPLSITVELRPQEDDNIEGYRGFMVPTEQVNVMCVFSDAVATTYMFCAVVLTYPIM